MIFRDNVLFNLVKQRIKSSNNEALDPINQIRSVIKPTTSFDSLKDQLIFANDYWYL